LSNTRAVAFLFGIGKLIYDIIKARSWAGVQSFYQLNSIHFPIVHVIIIFFASLPKKESGQASKVTKKGDFFQNAYAFVETVTYAGRMEKDS